MEKVIRTICLFTDHPSKENVIRLSKLTAKFIQKGFTVQTQRLCSNDLEGIYHLDQEGDGSLYLCLGELTHDEAQKNLERVLTAKNIAFNVNLTDENINAKHTALLTEIIQKNASKTFNFTYTFNNAPSSPFFPSATYQANGFSIGLQPTDLSEGCKSVEEWLDKLSQVWREIEGLVGSEPDFLGIDASIAPIFEGKGSFVNFIKRIGLDFSASVTTNTYLKITKHLKSSQTKTVGLCGLMFPCLEDFELADEYEKGNFSIERNVFLSLHSGLGIDTYPIGIDEKPERIVEILKLVQGLSNKYQKPLSARFVSDGKAKIGEKTNFQNQYLKDVVVKPL